VISEEQGYKLENATLSYLGEARTVTIDKDNSIIVEGKGEHNDVVARINEIKVQIDKTTSDYDKEKLQERLAKLSGGVAVLNIGAATEVELKEKKARVEDALHATRAAVKEGIVPGGGVAVLNIGAATEVEMKEKKARVEDALHATRAAVKEGIVPGGGVALLRAIDSIKTKGMNADEAIGAEILKKALEYPCRIIVRNAGHEDSVVVNKVKESKGNIGFDARNDKYTDMVKAGIIDPTLVTRTAVQNAASIAGLMLTTECTVSDKPEPPSSAPAMPGGGDMGGMGGMGGMM